MTGQVNRDSAAGWWGFQGFSLMFVEEREAPTKAFPSRRVKVIGLRDDRASHICGRCGRRHAEAHSQETEPRLWRHCSIGDLETYVEVLPCRVQCCGGTRVESFPWQAPGTRMTQHFFLRTAALCTRLPVLEVAKMANLSWETVARVDKRAIRLGLGGDAPALDHVRRIGIDEVSRTGGHDYFTIATALDTGAVVHVGDGKGRKGLQSLLERMPNKARAKVVTPPRSFSRRCAGICASGSDTAMSRNSSPSAV